MSRRGRLGLGISGAAALGAALLLWHWYLPLRGAVGVGAGMLAKQICSCVYVAGREPADCRADQFPSMDPIEVEVLRDAARVRAFVTGFGERIAIHRDGLGCMLE